MFANLKKKIEEEVGDLGRLTSPLTSFGNSDRRVSGSSTQGTNTPGLGSRQSSVASLIDTVDHRSNHHAGPVLTPRSAHNTSFSETSNDHVHANEIKKLNQEWHRKLEQLKKTYEDKLQTQELDFAWKYNAKDEEIEKLRVEKKRNEDQIKAVEGGYQQKLTRVQEDIDQLEGFSKQENAKIKHLLLNTQEELSQLKSQLFSKDQEIKQTNEDIRSLRIENENLHKNLDRITAKQSTTASIAEERQLPPCNHDEKEIELLKTNLLNAEQKLQELDQKSKEIHANFENEVLVMKVNFESQLAQVQSKFDNLIVQKSKLELEVADLNKYKAMSIEHDSINGKLRSQLKALEDELQNAKQDNNKAETLAETKKSLENNVSKIETELTESHNLLEERQKDIEVLKQDLASTEHKLRDQKNKCKDMQSNFDNEIQMTKSNFKEQMMEAQSKLKDMVAQKSKFESEVAELHKYQSLCEEKDTEVQRLSLQLKELEKQVQTVRQEHSQMETLTEAKDSLQNSITKLSTELKKTRQQLLEKKNEVEALKSGLASTEQKLTEQTSRSNEAHADFEKKVDEIKANFESQLAQAQSDNLIIQKSKLELEIAELNKYESINTEKDTEIERLNSELNKYESNNKEKDTEIKRLNSDITKYESITTEKGAEIEKLNSEIKGLEDQLQVTNQENSQIGALTKINENLQKTIAKLESSGKEIRMGLKDKTKEVEDLNLRITSSDKELKDEKLKIQDIQVSHLAEIQNIKQKFETQLSNELLKIEDLNAQKSALEQEIAKSSIYESVSLEKDSEIYRLSTELKILENKLQTLERDNSQLALLTEVNENMQENITKLESIIKQTQLESNKWQEEIQQLNGTNGKLETENHELIVQASELQAKVDEFEEEIVFLKEQIELQTTKDVVKDNVDTREMQGLTERVRELEAQVQEKNKALKHRQQQLQDLRKSLAKELKSSANPDSLSMASNSSSLHSINKEDVSLEEISLNHGQQLIQSHQLQPNHNHHDNNISQPASLPPYETDVNFQYLRSVVFKYLTSHDPQVTTHLTRVVGTLLHLSEEEQQLLSHSTESRLSWTASLLHKS